MDRPQSRAYELWDRVGRSFHVDRVTRERCLVPPLAQFPVEEARITLSTSQACASFRRIALAHIIHDSSSRNCGIALRDGRTEPRGREADLKQSVDRPSGESARQRAAEAARWLVAAANARLQQKRS